MVEVDVEELPDSVYEQAISEVFGEHAEHLDRGGTGQAVEASLECVSRALQYTDNREDHESQDARPAISIRKLSADYSTSAASVPN